MIKSTAAVDSQRGLLMQWKKLVLNVYCSHQIFKSNNLWIYYNSTLNVGEAIFIYMLYEYAIFVFRQSILLS